MILYKLIIGYHSTPQGGNGLADVIFGRHSPAGRAATTFYLDDGEF
jgi:hypothetical protein